MRAYRENAEFKRRAEEQAAPPKVYNLVGKTASEVAALHGEVSGEKLAEAEVPSVYACLRQELGVQ